MKKVFCVLILISVSLYGQSAYSTIASKPGAFTRLGFGARGKGMANAMTSVISGNLVSYYNPAITVFQEGNSFQTSYSILSLDRSLNFLNFTRRFELGKKNPDGTLRDKPKSVAGISAGVINAGVSDFDARDNQGLKIGTLSPFENQFFVAFANRFSEKFSVGVAAKFYYSKLYDEITSTTIGFDIGAIYRYNDQLTIGATLADINSKYKWDTTKLYGQDGRNSEEKFPILKRIGVSYKFDNPNLLASIEFEGIDGETNYLRAGAEYYIHENLVLRGGIDNFNLSNSDFPIRPALGFSYFYNFNSLIAGVDYAFVVEPYSSHDQHIVGINLNF